MQQPLNCHIQHSSNQWKEREKAKGRRGPVQSSLRCQRTERTDDEEEEQEERKSKEKRKGKGRKKDLKSMAAATRKRDGLKRKKERESGSPQKRPINTENTLNVAKGVMHNSI